MILGCCDAAGIWFGSLDLFGFIVLIEYGAVCLLGLFVICDVCRIGSYFIMLVACVCV